MKLLLFLLLPLFALWAQTPFTLTKFKSAYPLVEINTPKVPIKYKAEILATLLEYTKELGINTKGFSERPIAILVSRVAIGKTLVLKVELLIGEEVKRLDDDEIVFALTYQQNDIFEVEELEEDLIDSVEMLLESFKDQYIEDNE